MPMVRQGNPIPHAVVMPAPVFFSLLLRNPWMLILFKNDIFEKNSFRKNKK